MSFARCLLLLTVSLFCLALLTACQNNAPADQLTVVQGTVTSADTGRPVPGVLLGIESFSQGFYGVMFELTADSVRTDAQGRYQLSFRNQKGLYYAVGFEPTDYIRPGARRYGFVTQPNPENISGGGAQHWAVKLGQTNVVDFKPNEVRTVAVRIRNRNTGYQRLEFDFHYLHGNSLDTTAYLRGVYLPTTVVKYRYLRYSATGAYLKDTLVALVVQNPAALPPDTLRATLTFAR